MRNLILFFLACPLGLPAQGLFDSLYIRSTLEIYFPFGAAEADAPSCSLLDSFAAVLPDAGKWAFLNIEAHTDSIGNPEANERLAGRRAEWVRQYLLAKGVPEARVRIRAYGERRPAADNSTEEGRQRNRRAALELWAAVPMANMEGYIRDAETGKGIETTVYFTSKTRNDSTQTDTAGFYRVRLPKDSIVRVEATAQGYFFESFMTKVFGSPELYKKYKKEPNISLPPAKVGEKAVLRDLFFVGNQAVLLPVSEPELPKILRFMQVNPDLSIEIAGHINQPAKTPDQLSRWEWDMSIDRAKVVFDYLLKNGIPDTRMTYKGYGNTEMLFPAPGLTENEYQQNRRVEIRIVAEK